jgi:cysteine desulfurase
MTKIYNFDINAGFQPNPSNINTIRGKLLAKQYRGNVMTLRKIFGDINDIVLITSGASESNTTVLNTIRRSYNNPHVIITDDNHPSIKHILEEYDIDYTICELNTIGNAIIEDRTVLICIPYVCPLTGHINFPLKKNYNVDILCDATQVIGKIKVNRKLINASFLTFSFHKCGGPVGIGCLISSKELKPLIPGSQQSGLRGGTLNCNGLEKSMRALSLSMTNMIEKRERITKIMKILYKELKDYVDIISKMDNNIGNVIYFKMKDDATNLVRELSKNGYDIGQGCACSKVSLERIRISIPMDFDGNINEFIELLLELIKKYKL